MGRPAILILSLLLAPVPCRGQSPLPPLTKGQRITLRIPPSAFVHPATIAPGQSASMIIASRSGQYLIVNGMKTWAGKGLGPSISLLIANVRFDAKRDRLTIRLTGSEIGEVAVAFRLSDKEFILPRVFAAAADSARVGMEMRQQASERIFTGSLGLVSTAAREQLLTLLSSNHHYAALEVITYQNRKFLSFNARESTYTCDERDPAVRYAIALEEVAVPILQNVGIPDSSLTSQFGFAVTVSMKQAVDAPGFGCADAAYGSEVKMYVPANVARDFAAQQVSVQQVFDSSEIIAGGLVVKARHTQNQ